MKLGARTFLVDSRLSLDGRRMSAEKGRARQPGPGRGCMKGRANDNERWSRSLGKPTLCPGCFALCSFCRCMERKLHAHRKDQCQPNKAVRVALGLSSVRLRS